MGLFLPFSQLGYPIATGRGSGPPPVPPAHSQLPPKVFCRRKAKEEKPSLFLFGPLPELDQGIPTRRYLQRVAACPWLGPACMPLQGTPYCPVPGLSLKLRPDGSQSVSFQHCRREAQFWGMTEGCSPGNITGNTERALGCSTEGCSEQWGPGTVGCGDTKALGSDLQNGFGGAQGQGPSD